jgi:hypothetical protein
METDNLGLSLGLSAQHTQGTGVTGFGAVHSAAVGSVASSFELQGGAGLREGPSFMFRPTRKWPRNLIVSDYGSFLRIDISISPTTLNA